ncbi:MAG: hypothetical protein MZW92_50415 [Comamonadaceae bacterium]|nr:hypothetical protein [Comamonadaceae bacterium]
MVLALVLLPPLAAAARRRRRRQRRRTRPAQLLGADARARSAAFVALMLVVGRRLLPWLLWQVAAHRLARAVHARA